MSTATLIAAYEQRLDARWTTGPDGTTVRKASTASGESFQIGSREWLEVVAKQQKQIAILARHEIGFWNLGDIYEK